MGPKQLWEMTPDELSIMKTEDGEDFLLGSGGYGTVYKALRDQTDTVAIKILKGHQDQRTTQVRLHLADDIIRDIPAPLDTPGSLHTSMTQ